MRTLINLALVAIVRAVVALAFAVTVGFTALVISVADTSNASLGVATAVAGALLIGNSVTANRQ